MMMPLAKRLLQTLSPDPRRLTCQMRLGELGAMLASTNMKLRKCMAACMRESMLHDEMIRDIGLARSELDRLLSEQVATGQSCACAHLPA